MVGIRGTGIDPTDQEGPLIRGEWLAERFRWHLRTVRGMDPRHHHACCRIPGNDRRRTVIAGRQCGTPDVEPQAPLAGVFVRPVTIPAMVGKDRLHRPSQLQISLGAPCVHGHPEQESCENTDRGDLRPVHPLSHRRALPRSTPATPTAAGPKSLDRSRISPEYPHRSSPTQAAAESGLPYPLNRFTLPRRTGNLTAMQGRSLQQHRSRPGDERKGPLPSLHPGLGRAVFQSGKKPPLTGELSKIMIHSGQRPHAASTPWVAGDHSSPSESRQADVSCGS